MTVKKLLLFISAFVLLACGGPDPVGPQARNNPDQVAACDWIRGAGVGTTGGEGGQVIRVTKLTDDIDPATGQAVAGTLRFACEQKGARIIVFSVAGTIHLVKELRISEGNLTIAGQTAPGDGICLADYPLVITGSNVIVRFLRVRLGDKSGREFDAVSVNGTHNVVLDHLSCSWSTDECVSCYGNTNFTMQYCFISEALTQSVHWKGNHGYGGIWGGENVSFHHNLLAHHDSRNPRFDHDYVDTKAGPIDYINNVVYNWGGNSSYGGEGSSNGGGGRKINFINNYYKPGPATKNRERLMNPWASCDNCVKACGGSVVAPKLYMTGNYMHGSDKVTKDNWQGVNYSGGATEAMCKVTSRYTFTNAYTSEETAEQAYERVLAKAGCSLSRDALDKQVVEDVRAGSFKHKGSKGSTNGLIDTPSDAGGWPELKGTKLADSDFDGMPDEWELANELNPNDAKDGLLQTLVTGHTNLEVYLCDIVKHLY